jgi:polysaccharide pyruvyl transferase WcaK-like protein
MEIRIITIHFGTNHGSALQSYALTHILNKKGYNAKIIDYIPERYNAWKSVKERKANDHPIIVVFVYYLLTSYKRIRIRKIFEKFLEKNVPLTRRYRLPDELKSDPPDADVYITGSDQVWNYDYNSKNDYTYFLDFVPIGKKKISYAASFGKDTLTKEEISEYSPMLNQFNAISVRESSGLDILKTIKCNGINTLDPTLLIDKNEWVEKVGATNNEGRYLLIYVMDGLYEKLLDYGYEIAKSLGLKIYVISFSKIKDKRIDKNFIHCNPFDYVRMMNEADYIVTNSFHGTAFSINLNKQFISVAKSKYNTRITCLLELFGLNDRFVVDDFNLNNALLSIDYNVLSPRLTELRRESLDFLMTAIES